MSNVTLIKLPELPNEVNISQDWYNNRDEILALSKEIVTVDSENYDLAANQLKAVTSASSEVEKIRKGLGAPYTAAAKKIKQVSDEARKPLEDEKSRLKAMMGAHQEKIEKARQLAEEEAQRQAMANSELEDLLGLDGVVDMTQPAAVGPVTAKGSAVTWTYQYEVVDMTKVPRAWLILDDRAVREYAREQKDNASIPGIKFTKKANVKSR